MGLSRGAMRCILRVMLLCVFCGGVNTSNESHTTPRQIYAALRPGRLSNAFRQVASHVAVNNTLLVTFSNRGYAHFVQNMVATLRRQGVNNTLVFALDAEAEAYFQREQIAVHFAKEFGSVSPNSQLFNADVRSRAPSRP